MTGELHIVKLFPNYLSDRESLRSFLAKHQLKFEEQIQAAYGVLDECGRLRACGCAEGSILKCFAVDPELRGQNILGQLVSHLVQNRFSAGLYHLFIVTREKNRALFANCGFTPLTQAAGVVLLDNQPDGPGIFAAPLRQPGDERRIIGALVMNCNPFTLGHRALAEFACRQCDAVYLFVVEEDRSLFSAQVRLDLVREGTADLPNIRVYPSGPYMISSATFPTYFLKEGESAAEIQSQLDISLFAQRIAPLLHITRRFAGSEPLDTTTASYNRAMSQLLPRYGIEFVEMERKERAGAVISASRVRKLLSEYGVCREVLDLVPPSTGRYLKKHFSRMSV